MINTPRELIDEPLNRVLIIDKNSSLADVNNHDNWQRWMDLNLIIAVDYGENTFTILKNRWGLENNMSIPLYLLETFLLHPELTNINDLDNERNNI
jgi:hypothetical protein